MIHILLVYVYMYVAHIHTYKYAHIAFPSTTFLSFQASTFGQLYRHHIGCYDWIRGIHDFYYVPINQFHRQEYFATDFIPTVFAAVCRDGHQ